MEAKSRFAITVAPSIYQGPHLAGRVIDPNEIGFAVTVEIERNRFGSGLRLHTVNAGPSEKEGAEDCAREVLHKSYSNHLRVITS